MVKVLLIDPALAGYAGQLAEQLPPDVEVAAVTTFDDDEFRQVAADATVLVNARRPIDADRLRMAPMVGLIQMVGAGTDTIDRAAIAAAGIQVAYNPGVNRTGVAEHAILLMLALLKRLPVSERVTREGAFSTGEVIGRGIDDLAGATVGLIGMGHIGRAVAERLLAFEARVVYHARRPVAAVEADLGITWQPLDGLLRASQIVSLHLPLTPATRHFIGAAEIATMPAGSYLINTGRGGLVDEDALRQAVVTGHLAGAGLDVLEHENDGRNPFADLPQVIVTPHVAGGSRGSMAGVVDRTAANIRRFIAGDPIRDPVPD